MTAKEQAATEKAEAIEYLRNIIAPGDTVRTILRHVSRSGMSRSISLVVVDEEGNISDVSWWAARAMSDRIDQNNGGIKVGGCGMDMGFHLVYNLARTLYPTYNCLGLHTGAQRGRSCPSNEHTNARNENYAASFGPDVVHSDGYCLSHRWL